MQYVKAPDLTAGTAIRIAGFTQAIRALFTEMVIWFYLAENKDIIIRGGANITPLQIKKVASSLYELTVCNTFVIL
jgi:hypothetical protein